MGRVDLRPRALDCQARGGLGFLPLEHGHSFSTLGCVCERTERPAKPRLDECYPVRLVSSLDDAAQLWGASGGARQGSQSHGPAPCAPVDGGNPQEGVPLLHDGGPITISHGEGVWVPVAVAHQSLPAFPSSAKTQVVLPRPGPLEAIPGIWEDHFGLEGEICVVGDDEFDVELEKGTPIAEVVPASIRTQVC